MYVRLALLGCCVFCAAPAVHAAPEDSVVKVIVTVRYPEIARPWVKGNSAETHGTGVIIDGKRILTNAHVVMHATEVYVQARPGDDKLEAKIQAVAPDVDLALLTVANDGFFDKRPPLPRSDRLPKVPASVGVYGYPIGGTGLSVTKGELARIVFNHYGTRGMGMVFQITAAVNPGNSGGPVLEGDKMIGLVFSRPAQLQQIGSVVPNEEIELFLQHSKNGPYAGKPVEATGTLFQNFENEALRHMLKVDPAVKGILARPPRWRDASYPLRENDVIVKAGEYPIGNTGTAPIENGLYAPFQYVISRLAQTHKEIPLTIWRQGKTMHVALPVTQADPRLLRSRYGAAPEYFIHGPLVFVAASADDLTAFGAVNPTLYVDNSPLVTRSLDNVAFPGEELVAVSAPLFPHKIAKGYYSHAGKVVKQVNGVRIKNLRHLVETLRDSTDEFLRFEFADNWSEVLVFERQAMARATEEILEDNGIAPARRGSPNALKIWNDKR